MKRGEHSIAITVLVTIGMVGVVSSLVLYANSPTGTVFQYDTVYPTEQVPYVYCQQGRAMFMGMDSEYAVYCCPEDLVGQNECYIPQRILQR